MYDAKVMAERKTRETWFFRVCCFVVDPLCTPCDDRASTFLLLRRDTFAIPGLWIVPLLSFHSLPMLDPSTVYFQSRTGNFQFRNSLMDHYGSKKKKKEKKLVVTMDRFRSHTTKPLVAGHVVIKSSLMNVNRIIWISLYPFIRYRVTHTIRFYLKVSRNISLYGHHRSGLNTVSRMFATPDLVESSRFYFSLAGPIEAEMYESRSMTRNRNVPFPGGTLPNGMVVYPLEQMVKPSTKRFRFMAADKL